MSMDGAQSRALDFHLSSTLDCVRRSVSSHMDSLGTRLQSALDARKRTPKWLWQEIGVTKQTVYSVLNDVTKPDKIRASTVDAICGALEINRRWFLTGKGSMDDAEAGDWPDILAYRQAAALGAGTVPDEYAETHKLKFRSDSLARKKLRPDRLGVVYGRGDSMLPRIKTGDAIMFDTSAKVPVDGKLFVISYDGGLMAKRLVLLGGRWFIESLNKDDAKWRKPQPIDDHKGFEIHGRVVWIGSWED